MTHDHIKYQFLHAPKNDPRNVAGEDWTSQLSTHVLYAITRSIPFAHLAKHLNCTTSEIVEECKRLTRNKSVGLKNGKRIVLKRFNLKHVSDSKMGLIYDLVTKDLPCQHIRVDDVGMLNSLSIFDAQKKFAVRYILNPSKKCGGWTNNWNDRSRWQFIMFEQEANTMTVNQLAKEIRKCLDDAVKPYHDRMIQEIASPLDV